MYSKKLFQILSLLIITIMMLTACAPAAPAAEAPAAEAPAAEAPAAEAPAAETKVITVGVNSENPPWIFMEGGTMTGFEADLVEEFAKRAGYEIEYKSAPFATVLTGVQSGQWDVAMSSIWVKQERVEVMDFADPYYDAQIGLMAPTEGGITAFDQMKGLVFGSDTGSANEAWLQEAQPKYGPYEMKSYDYWADAVMDLQAGRIDGVVVDAPIALYWIKQNPDAGISMPLYITDYNFAQSLAFQKGSPLVAEFNTVQNEMKKDGTLAAIHKKWFVSDPPADSCAINECPPYLPNEKPGMEKAMEEAPMAEAAMLVSEKVTAMVGSEPVKGGTLTMAIADITHMDPVSIAGDTEPYPLIFEGLFEFDMDWKPTPLLAESNEVSADGLVHTIKLRQGVKFHDGSDFNAEVVKWNFDRKIEQKSPYVAEIPFAADPVAVVDDYTVTITLTEPSFVMYNYLCGSSWVMYSKQFVESVTADDLKNQGIGTGPYVLTEYLPGDRIVVDANLNYWQEGMPYLDQIVMRIVADANTRLLMLEAGEVQYVKDLSIQDLTRLEGNAEVVTITAPSTRTYHIPPHHSRRPFDDVRVRQALNYGVDREAMNDAIYEGKFIISTGVSTATVVGSVYNEPYPYDPEKAMALLDEAGVVDTNNDGFREVDGAEKEFIFWTRKGQRAGDIEIAETFTAYMAEIGLKFKIEVQDSGQYFTLLNQPFGEAPYYDITNHAPSNFIADMSYPLETMYSCTSWPGTAFNYAHYCNEEVDALINEGNLAGTIEERNAKYAEAQNIIWEDAVSVWLFDGILTVATTPELKGVFSDGAHNVWQVKYAWFVQ